MAPRSPIVSVLLLPLRPWRLGAIAVAATPRLARGLGIGAVCLDWGLLLAAGCVPRAEPYPGLFEYVAMVLAYAVVLGVFSFLVTSLIVVAATSPLSVWWFLAGAFKDAAPGQSPAREPAEPLTAGAARRRVVFLLPYAVVLPVLAWSLAAAFAGVASPTAAYTRSAPKPAWLSSRELEVLASPMWGVAGAVGLAWLLIAGLHAVPAQIAAKLDRTRCRECGYSREGLDPGACCPECGVVPLKQEPVGPEFSLLD